MLKLTLTYYPLSQTSFVDLKLETIVYMDWYDVCQNQVIP